MQWVRYMNSQYVRHKLKFDDYFSFLLTSRALCVQYTNFFPAITVSTFNPTLDRLLIELFHTPRYPTLQNVSFATFSTISLGKHGWHTRLTHLITHQTNQFIHFSNPKQSPFSRFSSYSNVLHQTLLKTHVPCAKKPCRLFSSLVLWIHHHWPVCRAFCHHRGHR